jgi:ACS family glucarate transporter-like MFS transporter
MSGPDRDLHERSPLEPSNVPRPTRVRFAVLAAGCGLAFLAYVHRQSFVRAQPYIATDLGLNDQQFGYLTAAFLIGYGLFQVPCGLLSDRFGARHLLATLVLVWSFLTGLQALAGRASAAWLTPLAFLVVTRFAFGVAQAGYFPVWSRVMADWIPLAERGTAQGTVWMFSRVGGAAAPFLFDALLKLCGIWTTPLWLLAALGPCCAVPFWFWFRNRPDEVPRVNAAERQIIAAGRTAPAADAGDRRIPWRALLTSVNVWALCLMYGLVGSAGNFITTLLPNYLDHTRHLSQRNVTWITAAPLAMGVMSCALGGVLSDWIIKRWGSRKWGRRLNAAIGLVLAGLSLAVIPWVEPVGLMGALFAISFFCNDLMIGPAWAACVDVGERYAGTISGVMNMTNQFFGAAGMAFAGYMLHRGATHILFPLFGCSYLLAALCWFLVDVTRPLRIDQGHEDRSVHGGRSSE